MQRTQLGKVVYQTAAGVLATTFSTLAGVYNTKRLCLVFLQLELCWGTRGLAGCTAYYVYKRLQRESFAGCHGSARLHAVRLLC